MQQCCIFLFTHPSCSTIGIRERVRQSLRKRERQVSLLSLPNPTPNPHQPHPSQFIWERRERMWQPTQALVNLTSNIPVFVVQAGEEVTGGTWIKAPHTHKRTRTYTVHMRAHTDTNTCTVLAHRSLIFSSNHLLSATAAFTANCSCVCVCVYVINQWCDSAPQTAMVAQLLPFYTHLIHFVSFVMDKADNLLLSEKCFGL